MKEKRIKRKNWFRILGLVVWLMALFLGIWQIGRILRQSVWDGRHQINVIINARPLIIFSYDKKRLTPLNILTIPNNTLIEATHGYGFYQIGAIYDLGNLERKFGGTLLTESVQEYLGIPLDAYISIPNSKEEVINIVKSLINFQGETNLSKWDLWRLWNEFRNLRQDKINLVDLRQTEGFAEEVLVDETKVGKIDGEKITGLLNQLFINETLRQEDFSVGVYNASAYSGLANQAARLLTNIGGRVIEVGQEEPTNDCLVISGKNLKDSYSVKKIAQIFKCRQSQDSVNHRADIVLILGENYADKLKKMW